MIKSKVYDEITLLIAANGGKLKHGEIPRIVKKYNAAGSTFITIMVVRHLIDTKVSYVKTKPIKEVICDDSDRNPPFLLQTDTTDSYNNSNKQGKNNNKTATNKALVEKVTYHICLEYSNLKNLTGTRSFPPKTLQKIIDATVELFGVERGSIPIKTI